MSLSALDGGAAQLLEAMNRLDVSEQGIAADSANAIMDEDAVVVDLDQVDIGLEDNNKTGRCMRLCVGTGDSTGEDERCIDPVDGSEGDDGETTAAATPRASVRCVLEDFTQCSESHLWRLMMSFYDRKGPESWSQGIVPHFITSNAYIGRTYAKVLHGYLHDCAATLDPSQPLYIIELGAGSGKFSFYMLRALDELQDMCGFPFKKMVYVMTDFTQNNFDFWCAHPSLKPYFDRGVLDAAIFNAVTDTSIRLWKSGKLLSSSPDSVLGNPVCVVANYLFDTLCHDIFQVSAGCLKQGLISVGSSNASEPDPLDPDIIQRLDNAYRYETINSSSNSDDDGGDGSYYASEEGDEAHLQLVLDWYRDYFASTVSGASFLMPIGALRAVRRIAALSSKGTIVVSGDKGNNCPEHFIGLSDPYIAVHGSFSLMVNYHAIGLWCTARGGFALHNPQEEASLKVSCFVLPPHLQPAPPLAALRGDNLSSLDSLRSQRFKHLRLTFNETCTMFGPNDFFVLQKSLKEEVSQPSLRSVVSMLKLSDWDPDVFFKFRDVILAQSPCCGGNLRNDLARGIPRLWTNFFALDADKDIAFEIGRFYYGVRDYNNALLYYQESIRTVGEHHITVHNQGLCYYSQGSLDTALSFFSRSLALNSSYDKARSWIDKVSREMSEQAGEQRGGSSSDDRDGEPSKGTSDLFVESDTSASE